MPDYSESEILDVVPLWEQAIDPCLGRRAWWRDVGRDYSAVTVNMTTPSGWEGARDRLENHSPCRTLAEDHLGMAQLQVCCSGDDRLISLPCES
jgi:hypothetical protein